MPISNSQIKLIRSLQTKKYRDGSGLFVVEGEKMVREALSSGLQVENVFRKDDIGGEAMARISSLSSPSPVLAVVRKPCRTHLAMDKGLYLALDSIRDPGNLGTIMRIADWFGASGICASPDTVDLFNPKVVQSTMGAIFRIPFIYTDLPAACEEVLAKGGKVYGTFLDGENMYSRDLETGEDVPVLIVIGNEANGISREVEDKVSDRLFVPPYPADEPGSESLNAAVATAIVVSEFRRRTL